MKGTQPDQTQIHPHRHKYRIVPRWSEEMQEFELGRHKLLQVWGLSLKSILRFNVLTGCFIPCFWLFILLQLAAVVFWGPGTFHWSGFTSILFRNKHVWLGWHCVGTGLFLGLAATAQGNEANQASRIGQEHQHEALRGVVTSTSLGIFSTRSGNTPWKFNSSPLKNDGWKTILFLLGPGAMLNFGRVVMETKYYAFRRWWRTTHFSHLFSSSSENMMIDS